MGSFDKIFSIFLLPSLRAEGLVVCWSEAIPNHPRFSSPYVMWDCFVMPRSFFPTPRAEGIPSGQ